MGKKKLLALVLVVLVFVSVFSGCSTAERIWERIIVASVSDQQNKQDERSAYEILYDGVCQFESEITGLSKFSEQELVSAYTQLLRDYPEFFWVWESYTIYTSDDGTVSCFCPELTMDVDKARQAQEVVLREAEKIVEAASSLEHPYEKALFIHDYIVNSIDYDTDALKNDILFREASTIYGVLINKKAICSGYAKAYQYLLELCGVNAICVGGYAITDNSNQAHMWNIIQLDQEYYHVDVTWDDPVVENTAYAAPSYAYFCLTTNEILQDHTIDHGQNIPDCTATKYNYYIYNHLFSKKYTFGDVYNIVERAANDGKKVVEIKFGNAYELKRAIDDLYVEERIFEIPCMKKFKEDYAYYNIVLGNCLLVVYLT